MTRPIHGTGQPILACAWIAVAVFAFVAGSRIEGFSLAENQDPGPRALPWLMATLLAMGGIHEFILFFRRKPELSPGTPEPLDLVHGLIRSKGLRLAMWVLGLLLGYCLLIPWLGFMPATLLFSIIIMRILGTGWLLSSGATLILLTAIHLLFVLLFKVQLPPGVLGIPFL